MIKKLSSMGQWNVTYGNTHGLAECVELEGFGIVGAVIDTEGESVILRRAIACSELLEELSEAERVIRWAAQESAGRVKQEIVGGWLHHANKIKAAIAKAR